MDNSNNAYTPSTPPASTTPAQPTIGIKVRVPVHIRPYFPDENITYDNITYDFDKYYEITARQDESAYNVLPTGRIVAGSKRAAKARDRHPVLGAGAKPEGAEAEITTIDVRFCSGAAGAFEGFGGLKPSVAPKKM